MTVMIVMTVVMVTIMILNETTTAATVSAMNDKCHAYFDDGDDDCNEDIYDGDGDVTHRLCT